jgi:putative endopeptidase
MTTRRGAFLALACLVLAAASCQPERQGPASRPAPQPVAPAGALDAVDPSGRDLAVAPGADFEEYANGGWRKVTEIPADRSSTGIFDLVFDRAEQRNAALIREAGAGNPPAGSSARRIADCYAAFMDEAGIERKGIAPLQPALDRIVAIRDKGGLATALGEDLRADVDPLNATNLWTENLFGVFVAQALDDPSRNVPYLLQGGLGMPDREYYLSAALEMEGIRAKYLAYVTDLLRLAGVADPAGRAQRIVALETDMARAHASLVESEDVHKADNPWRRADFPKKAPGLDWKAFFRAAGLDAQPMLVAWQPGAIKGLSALVASGDLETWKDYLTFHALNRNASFLPAAFSKLSFGFYGRTLEGTPEQRERWKRAVSVVNMDLGDAVGQVYVQHHFPPEAKAQIEAIVKNLIAALGKRIDALEWMTPATRAKARAKLLTLRVGVGYPATWRDYSGLDIRPDDALGNHVRAQLFELRHQLAKLGRPVDRDEWWMTPQTVNAVNLPLQNALNFPAAILEPPFFDPAADPAANYGSIGAVIGHEISHSFDNMGAEFDSDGRLANWWTPDDHAHFEAAGRKLVAQYDAYEPFPGLHINGTQTLGENIADVAGAAIAFDAWRLAQGDRAATAKDGLTGEQRFFLAFAQSWRDKTREPALRQRIVTDGHAPGRWRAQTVRNLDAWYDAFGVKPGDALYLAPADRVRIW